MASFEKFGVVGEIIQAIEELDWLLPTDVQDEAIPLILGGGDVMVAAETGSGKTASFAIPILQLVYETLRGEADTSIGIQGEQKLPQVKLFDHDQMFNISEDGLSGESTAGWQGARANIGLIQGKYYWEARVIKGLCRVGWGTNAASFNIGKDNLSWGYGGTGLKSHNNEFTEYGTKFADSDVIGIYADFDEKELGYYVNGKDFGIAHKFRVKDAIYPAVFIKDACIEVNFGSHPFKYPPPKDFKAVQNAPVSDTSLKFRAQSEQESFKTGSGPLGLVLAPTRDLATQLFEDFKNLKKYLRDPPVELALCVGGVNKMVHEIKKAHIIIGTCGSIVGLIESDQLTLNQCKFFVIDEADRVLDKAQEQQQQVKAMFSRMSASVQVMLFSATLHSPDITDMSKILCKNPQWVDLKGMEYVPDTVHHCVLVVDPVKDRQWVTSDTRNIITDGIHQNSRLSKNSQNLRPEEISEGIKLLKPLIFRKVIEAFRMDQCLVFCRTKLDCDNLEQYLISIGGGGKFRGQAETGKENPYSCVVLHSGRRQHERTENLHTFKEGNVRFLICTDVAARGIDIKALPFVINMMMPAESEDYIHRVGRVGRVGAPGVAISIMANHKEKVWYHQCPSRGDNCYDTRLKEEGGCAIWFDELEIFEAVEKRLGGLKIPILDQNNLDPNQVKEMLKDIERSDPLVAEAEKKVEQLKPRVEELSALETKAQKDWLAMPVEFTNMCKRKSGG